MDLDFNPLFINQILLFLINIFGVFLIFWVYLSGRKEKINQGFFLLVISNLLWIDFYNIATLPNQQNNALLWIRLTFASVFIFFISAYYLFILWFLNQKGWYQFLGKIVLILGFLLALFSTFTDLIISSVKFEKWWPIPIFSYEGKFIFHIFVIFFTALIIGKLILEYFKLPPETKLKAQYFLTGVFIFAGIIFILGVIFPFFLEIFKYYYLANYATIFLLGFTAYAIVKQQLFGIKVVLTALFVSFIAILLLLDALLFTSQFWLQIVKGGILIFFLYLGYALIKSVLKEIEEREKLEKLTEKLESAHIKLEAAYKKLKKLDEAKSEFLSIASHQLRTPLSAIKGYLSMFLEGDYGELSGKIKKPMENVYDANERLIKLVGNLLSVSRIEAGRVQMEFEKLSLEEIISSVVDELKIEAKKKNLKLVWKKPQKPLPKILLDKEKISEVLLNIIDNAIKYTKKGCVLIKSEIRNPEGKQTSSGAGPKSENQGKIIIQIKDTGEGMTQEEISKLFQSFSRGTAGTRQYTEGVGLGLYIARRFVEMHQGKIWAESKGKGKGSTFYIELPVK